MKTNLLKILFLISLSTMAKADDAKNAVQLFIPMSSLQQTIDQNGNITEERIIPLPSVDPDRIFIEVYADVYYRGFGFGQIVGRLFQQTEYVQLRTGGDPGPAWPAGSLPYQPYKNIHHRIINQNSKGFVLEIDTSAVRNFKSLLVRVFYLSKPLKRDRIGYESYYSNCDANFNIDENGKIKGQDEMLDFWERYPLVCDKTETKINTEE